MATTNPYYLPKATGSAADIPYAKDIWGVSKVSTAATPAATAANQNSPWSLPSPVAAADTSGTTQPDFFGSTPKAEDVYKPIRIARIPGANPYIQSSFGEAARLHSALGSDLDDYRMALNAGAKPITDFTGQDIGNLDYLYNGGYARDLSAVRGRRSDAFAGLDNTLLADLRRTMGVGAVGTGGATGAGLGSWLAGRAAQEAGRLRSAEAYDAAGQERADVDSVMQAQLANVGRRQQLLSALAERTMLPAQYETGLTQAYQQAIQTALQQALANWMQSTAMSV